MIIVDSREKKWEHIRNYFEQSNIPYKDRIKLDVGDYFNPDYPYVVVDRKCGLQEVCNNLSRGKENYHRFLKECRRAHERRMKLIVLIEGTKMKKLDEVINWHSQFSTHTGSWLLHEMQHLSTMYRVEWCFCQKKNTAEEILRLTHYER